MVTQSEKRKRLKEKLARVKKRLAHWYEMEQRIASNERVRDYQQASNRASRDEISPEELAKIIKELEEEEARLEQMLGGGAMRAQAVVPRDW